MDSGDSSRIRFKAILHYHLHIRYPLPCRYLMLTRLTFAAPLVALLALVPVLWWLAIAGWRRWGRGGGGWRWCCDGSW